MIYTVHKISSYKLRNYIIFRRATTHNLFNEINLFPRLSLQAQSGSLSTQQSVIG